MASEGTPATPSLAATVERIRVLRLKGPWPELRALFDDEARIESIATGTVSGPDETVSAMRAAAGDGVYTMGAWQVERVEENIALVSSTMRHLTARSTGGPE